MLHRKYNISYGNLREQVGKHLTTTECEIVILNSLFLSQVRVGPAVFGMGERNFTHSFDGFGKLYSWKFYGNGSASFSMDFLRTETYNRSVEENDIYNFMTFERVNPPFSFIKREQAVLRGFDNTNVNVYRIHDSEKHEQEYIALTDAWKIYKFEPSSLHTIGPVLPPKPSGTKIGFIDQMSSAHPLPEFNTTNHFTFMTSASTLGGKSRLSVLRIKSSYERELVAQWPVDKAPYMHSFSVTPNYVILFASAYYVDTAKIFKFGSAYDILDWYQSAKAHIYVVHIQTGKVHTFNVPNVYPSHHINAYEEGNKIIMDISMHMSPNFSQILKMESVRSPNFRDNGTYSSLQAFIRRYIIDMAGKNVTSHSFVPDPIFPFINYIETPCINENFRHKKYCYAYGVVNQIDGKSFSKTALVKKDVCGTNQDGAWSVDGHFPVEMWFIASPNATEEDDGILLTPVLHGDEKKTYLMILDGKTMAPINKAYVPFIVPFTIHGRFFPDIV